VTRRESQTTPLTPTAPATAASERCLNLAQEDLLRAKGPERSAAPLPPLAPTRPFNVAALKTLALHDTTETGPFDPAVAVAFSETVRDLISLVLPGKR